MRRALLLASVALLSLVLPSFAQGPDARWRTIEMPHFRIHYPADSEEWARRAASRLEAIWARVEGEVGYRPPEVVDVVVSDPIGQANGAAFPFLGWPRLVLWTSPPEPESELGHYSDWSELLLVHESTHLVHLLRPSRNPRERFLEQLVPLGPLTLKAPRWVMEGYATVVEGRLTGSGRPNGDLRAAILRRRAQEGRLPTYGQLNGDKSWRGFSMAYLMGSAYLEWLDRRAGSTGEDRSLPKLWARLSARRDRSFDEAFSGVYGDSPEALYGRFTAELTYGAVAAERAIAPVAREGELWQELSWTTGAPALSPDGSRLAIVLNHRDRPADLVVWATAPDEKAEKDYEKQRAEIAAEDPEDIPAVRSKPLARKPLHTLPTIDGVPPESPRFFHDGKSILFVRFEPDGEGFLHPDLFRWEVDRGGVERLTRGADLREPDPAPDGAWAVAVRNRNGLSQIVRVDLATGAVADLTPPSVDVVYDHPRLSPDGRRLAFVYHSDRAWRLAVRDLATGEQRDLAPPADGIVASPAWSADGRRVYAVVGSGGFLDVFAFPGEPSAGGAPVAVTRAQGGALAPEPTPDGKALFYLSLQSHGLDLYRLPLGGEPPTAPGEPAGTTWASLAPAVRPPPPSPPPAPFPAAAVPAGKPYGLGRQEVAPVLSASGTSAGETATLGARLGDVVGRFDLLALGALGHGAPDGGALAAAFRGLPVTFSFHLYDVRDRPSDRGGRAPSVEVAQGLFDLDRRGAELRAAWDRQFGPARVHLAGGGLREHLEPRVGPPADETVAFLSGRAAADLSRDRWHLVPSVGGHWEDLAGGSGLAGSDWRRHGADLGLGLRHGGDRLTLSYRRDSASPGAGFLEAYHLGGFASDLLPESAEANRIASPALPEDTLVGLNHEGERAELQLGAFPLPLFYERHRLWFGDDRGRGSWLDLAGLEWHFSTAPIPVGRVPALDFHVGAARILSAPYRGTTRWWLTTVLRP